MDVRRSIRFYQLLGFELIDLEGPPECPDWVRMHCEGGAVMFLLAEEPFDPTKHAVFTAMYTPDLPALREHLQANGIDAPPITHPGYMPSGSLSLRDPGRLHHRHPPLERRRNIRRGSRASSKRRNPECCRPASRQLFIAPAFFRVCVSCPCRRPSQSDHLYSVLNVCAGSVEAARRAGISPAKHEATASATIDVTSTPAPTPFTSYS